MTAPMSGVWIIGHRYRTSSGVSTSYGCPSSSQLAMDCSIPGSSSSRMTRSPVW